MRRNKETQSLIIFSDNKEISEILREGYSLSFQYSFHQELEIDNLNLLYEFIELSRKTNYRFIATSSISHEDFAEFIYEKENFEDAHVDYITLYSK